jgi:hypothetical protein
VDFGVVARARQRVRTRGGGTRARWRAGRLRWRAGSEHGRAAAVRRAAPVARGQRAQAWRHDAATVVCGGAAALGEEAALGEDAVRAKDDGGLRREKEDERDPNVRLQRVRSAFRAMTGRGGAASGHSPGSSWNDRPRPVRHDRTLTESGHKFFEKLKRMTGHGGGGRDRTRWSAMTRPMQRPVTDPGEVLRDDRTRWWTPGPDVLVKQHRVRCSVRSSVRSLLNAFLQSDL